MASAGSSVLLALLSLGLLACRPSQQRTTSPSLAPRPSETIASESPGKARTAQIQTRRTLTHPLARGLSGSCERSNEVFLVGERTHTLFRLSPDGQLKAFSIEGVPEGLELEGLACGPEHIYVSTESEETDRTSDIVLVLALDESRARVVDSFEMQYPPGLTASDNHGLEGLCLAGNLLVAAAELSRKSDEAVREAPILTQPLSGGPTQVEWVKLTSEKGKFSGIDCHIKAGVIDVFAIERHFGVARILRFQIGQGKPLVQEILPLESLLEASENYEAILVSPNGKIRLYNDNHYKIITGPSEEVSLVPDTRFSY